MGGDMQRPGSVAVLGAAPCARFGRIVGTSGGALSGFPASWLGSPEQVVQRLPNVLHERNGSPDIQAGGSR